MGGQRYIFSTILYILAVVVVITSIVTAMETRETILSINEQIASYGYSGSEEPQSTFAVYEIIVRGVVIAAILAAFGKVIECLTNIESRMNRNNKEQEAA